MGGRGTKEKEEEKFLHMWKHRSSAPSGPLPKNGKTEDDAVSDNDDDDYDDDDNDDDDNDEGLTIDLTIVDCEESSLEG